MFRKFFSVLLIGLLSVTSFASWVSAQEKSLEELREEVLNLMHSHKENTIFQERSAHWSTQKINMEKVIQYENALKKYLNTKGNVIKKEEIYYTDDKWNRRNAMTNELVPEYQTRSAGTNLANYTIEAGDILIFKMYTPPWWAEKYADSYHHAVLALGWNLFIEAPGWWKKSTYGTLHRYFHEDNMAEIILVKRNLFNFERKNIVEYAKKNLLNKPYPNWIPSAKYKMNVFYCTSLVWRAHMSAGEKVDLDGWKNTHFDIVYPLDFTRNPQVLDNIHYIQ